jgi:hypothetical protein
MNKIINTIFIVILLISCIGNVLLVSDLNKKTVELIELTDIEPEIIFLDSLVYDTVYIDRYQKVLVPVVNTDTINDTILVVDSIEVNIPIQKKHYSDTLAETAFSFDLSGYLPEVNNLYVQNLKVCPEPQKQPKKGYNNFSVGVGLGITYVDKFRLVPTFGISYNLFNF